MVGLQQVDVHEGVVPADTDDQVRGVGRQSAEADGDHVGCVPVHGQQGGPPARRRAAQVVDDGRTAGDVGGVVEDRVAEQDDGTRLTSGNEGRWAPGEERDWGRTFGRNCRGSVPPPHVTRTGLETGP